MRLLFYLAVRGDSMAPALRDGDWILAVRRSRVRRGDVVVLEHPQRPGMLAVKRVTRAGPDGCWVRGDAAEASAGWDSRGFGPLRQVVGRVVWRVRPWGPVRSRPWIPQDGAEQVP